MAELTWEGKYRDGKRMAPVRLALPFQTVETVNESAQDRKRTLDLFTSGKPTEWRNRLIWGDKKYVLPSLLPEFAGKVTLIYIDPPLTRAPTSHSRLRSQAPGRLLKSSHRSSSRRPIATHGGAASIPICNGSTKRFSFSGPPNGEREPLRSP
jgi:hypothetical protein